MEELCKIAHNNYEKISDTLLWLSNTWTMKFNVILNKYSNRYGRQNYHKEVMYEKDGNTCININRSFEYFITIEALFKDESGIKESVMIRNDDLYFIKYNLEVAVSWFTSQEYANLFAKKDGKIFMPSNIQPLRISNLPMDKHIEIEPTVLEMDNGDQEIGVFLFINSSSDRIFMNVSRLFGLKYFIDSFNMFQSAQLMINYLLRPEFGTNLYEIDGSVQSRKKYNNNTRNNLSYFDMIKKGNPQ